ncbi:signal peptidase I [Streptomyces sp. NPDC086010]|uniref:signal peptidase I n=1 Tax=Streptomyces sp. NPDC086010 TaxID=3365745 RepID=UPI0037D8A004
MGNRGRGRAGTDENPPLPTGSRPTTPRSLPTRAERRRLARKVKRRRRRSAIKEIPLLVVVALLIALVLKTFLVQAFVIPSGSMEQTIRIGDRVLVDKLTPWFGSEPQRGDVVVFKDPGGWLQQEAPATEDPPAGIKQMKELLTFIGLLPSEDEQDLIKRVVAVGGDTVKCCGTDGRITVNGVALDEPYLNPGDVPSTLKFEVKVPQGRIFVMGDHRSNSADSRFHLDKPGNGTVSEDEVVGRAVVIAWPFGHWRRLEEPRTYASVPDGRAGTAAGPSPSNSVSSQDRNGMVLLPTPAELPLVMGVVGLRRIGRGRWHGVRSGCGGFGGRRTIRTRRTRGPAL